MLFWVVNIRVHQTFGIKVLPSAGFGWDAHLIMPALVLAARPLAQIAQVTYVQVSQALSNAITTNRVGHAYLFTGPEGVGKRTLVAEFAKALLCASPTDGVVLTIDDSDMF